MQKIYFDAELKKVDDKTNTNSSKVLSYEHKLKQSEDTIHDLEREIFLILGVKVILVMMMICKIICISANLYVFQKSNRWYRQYCLCTLLAIKKIIR